VVELLNDKRAFYGVARRSNISTPKTFAPRSIDDVIDISRRIEYPCVLKPAFGYMYKHLHFKGTMARNSHELLGACKKLDEHMGSLLIQELVSGTDDNQYSLATYFNSDSQPLAMFTSRKLRQFPSHFGTGTFVASCVEVRVEELGISFLKKVHFQGAAEVEFKRDAKDGRLKMIEVNTRMWVQNSLALRCGIDLAYIAYVDMLGGKLDRTTQLQKEVKWLNFCDDFFACFGSSGYLAKREITLSNWLKSLMCKKEFALFCISDLKPFFIALKGCLIKFKKKIGRSKTW
jgi:predicted ATP-grasp superfamily ATP-dependent carboligase